MRALLFFFRLWFQTAGLLYAGLLAFVGWTAPDKLLYAIPLGCLGVWVAGLPGFIILWTGGQGIYALQGSWRRKTGLLLLLQLLICLAYGLLAMPFLFPNNKNIFSAAICTGVLLLCCIAANFFSLKKLYLFFTRHSSAPPNNQLLYQLFHLPINPSVMETYPALGGNSTGTRILLKGLLTAALVLLLLVPGHFVNNLIKERESRQQEVVQEVCSKWAAAQTLSGPYLLIPYNANSNAGAKKYLTLLPEDLSVEGNILPEERPRSIYRVLLYRSKLAIQGDFRFHLPQSVNVQDLQLANTSICFGLSDIRGMEEKLSIRFNNNTVDLVPGLPTQQLDSTGLSAPVQLNSADLDKPISFAMNLAIKGSGQLHFLPLSNNSRFTLRSSWPNPSFDGNTLPSTREVSTSGFTASWAFNQANLPFTTTPAEASIKKADLFFGISMLQPADQYAKTMRCAKYALLIISLSFALFFIIELLQKNPLHPVQYVLVGLALLVFYTLLLSISEFLYFDIAYIIAAAATVLLVSLYAWWHFGKWKITAVFALSLLALYSFIFILIRLEDTALLIGSIGLFVILFIVMYFSRKIKWYGESKTSTVQ